MSPEVGRAAFRLALFVVLLSLGSVLFAPPGSPGFIVAILSLGIGLVFLIVVIVTTRLWSR